MSSQAGTRVNHSGDSVPEPQTSASNSKSTSSNNNNNTNTNNNGNNTSASSNGKSKCSNLKQCASCGNKIADRFLLHAMSRFWHTDCLKCSCCQVPLGELGPSCFCKNGMILCKNDYARLFGPGGACSSCRQNIPANEFVMRAQNQVYHLKCFTCVTCHIQLVPGDRYSIVNGNLICEQDLAKMNSSVGNHKQMRSSQKVAFVQ